MKLKTSNNSQTPPPVGQSPIENIASVLPLYDKYFANQDPVNEPHYKHGKMIDKEITSEHISILKTLVYMLVDDIKSEGAGSPEQVEQVCQCIVGLIDLLPESPKNVSLNKRIAAKLIGYSLELHKLHI
jgi:hypothetical protein